MQNQQEIWSELMNQGKMDDWKIDGERWTSPMQILEIARYRTFADFSFVKRGLSNSSDSKTGYNSGGDR
jgi:hypothetical protein